MCLIIINYNGGKLKMGNRDGTGPAGYIDEISKKDYKYIEGESKK